MISDIGLYSRERRFSWFLQRALLLLLAWVAATQPLESVVALVCATAGAIILLRWPWFIWLVIALLLPITSGIKVGPISATDGLLLVASLLWFADGVRQRTLRLHGSPILIWLAIYVVSLTISLWGAKDFVEGSSEVVKWVEFALVIVLVHGMVSQRNTPWLVIALLVAGGGQALVGLYQFAFQAGPEWFIIFGRFMRASGTFAQPNPYAGYLGLTLPVAVSLAIWAGGEWWAQRSAADDHWLTAPPKNIFRFRPIYWFCIAICSAGLIGLGLLVSWSRGGWLGGIAGLGVVLFLRSRKTTIAGVFVLLGLLVMLLLGSLGPELVPQSIAARAEGVQRYFGYSDGNVQGILNEPVTNENFAILERLAHWVVAIRMWEDTPWLGRGPGNYATVYPEIIQADSTLQRWEEPLGHAHNFYLNVLAEGGLSGLVAYLIFWLGVIVWVWQKRREEHSMDRWTHALALGVLGIIAHLTVHNIFDNLFVQGIYIHISLWLAILHLPRKSFEPQV